MKNILKKESRGLGAKGQGFTIIEIMIVLAIAALIMLVVFLAVPALQRSQRNNARKTDVNRISASIISFVANTGGVPVAGNGAGNNLDQIMADVGTTGGYPALTNNNATAASTSIDIVVAGNGTPAALSTSLTNAIQIVTGGICSGAGATNANATSKNIALQYTLEASSTSSTVYCQNVQ